MAVVKADCAVRAGADVDRLEEYDLARDRSTSEAVRVDEYEHDRLDREKEADRLTSSNCSRSSSICWLSSWTSRNLVSMLLLTAAVAVHIVVGHDGVDRVTPVGTPEQVIPLNVIGVGSG